jgi:hypothetical protein
LVILSLCQFSSGKKIVGREGADVALKNRIVPARRPMARAKADTCHSKYDPEDRISAHAISVFDLDLGPDMGMSLLI